MQITVFGAGGKVGSLVVEEALKRGYDVVVFVHNRSLFSPSGKLIIKKGDVYNQQDVSDALRGSEAVMSCLGSWGTPRRDVLTSAMRAVVPSMREQHITRIVTLTGTGVAIPGRSVGSLHALGLKLLAPFPAGKVFHDGEEHLRVLADSDLDWTTLLSPVMLGGSDDDYRLATKGNPLTVNRRAVAVAMLDQLEDSEYVRQTAVIMRG